MTTEENSQELISQQLDEGLKEAFVGVNRRFDSPASEVAAQLNAHAMEAVMQHSSKGESSEGKSDGAGMETTSSMGEQELVANAQLRNSYLERRLGEALREGEKERDQTGKVINIDRNLRYTDEHRAEETKLNAPEPEEALEEFIRYADMSPSGQAQHLAEYLDGMADEMTQGFTGSVVYGINYLFGSFKRV